MLAGFIIRVCLACGWPQHAVGFHYVVYSYIVFVLLLHRTLEKETATSRFQRQVDGEGRGWSTLTSQDFVISIIQSAIFLLIKILSTQTWWKLDWVSGCCNSRGRERFACVAVGIDHIRYAPHMFPICSPYVSHLLPICSEVLTFNARMTTSAHMCFPYVEARPICGFVFRYMLPYVRQHMGHIQFGCFWKHSTYGPHMGCIWAAYELPICGPYVAHMFWTQ